MSTLELHATPPPRLIAPLRHTAVLAGAFVVFAVLGAILQQRVSAHASAMPRPGQMAPLYASLLAMEWGLVLYVWRAGLRRTGVSIREVVGGRWTRPREVATDLALALGFWGLWTLAGLGVDRLLGPAHAASIATLLPRSPGEILLWIALSLSAGFCEELVFRGYFQSQLLALTHRVGLAVVGQALLFGVSHGYQGVRACVAIAVYGLLLGVLARWRRSLRPGMLAHAWTDVAGGLFGW
jgi:uncharacterized protein